MLSNTTSARAGATTQAAPRLDMIAQPMLDSLRRFYWASRSAALRMPGAPRRRWNAIRQRRRQSVIEIGGVKLRLRPGFSLPLCENMLRGRYENDEFALLGKWLDPADKVMELGTGLGYLASFCALRIGSERVFTFEANPKMRDAIEDTFSLNQVDPTVEYCMLGAQEGSTRFNIGREFNASSTVQLKQVSEVIEAPMRRFDEKAAAIRPTFLICDIEGGEHELFQHVQIPTVEKILIELHPAAIGAAKVGETVAMIEQRGFHRADGTDEVALFLRQAKGRT